jgi:NADH dehydrogenase
MQRVVIVGGGFGGLYAARELNKTPVEVTLLDRRNFHLFQPLLYQVATGSLSPGEIAAPLRSVLRKQKNARVLLGEARDLDPQRRVLMLADGTEIPYDTLVVACGAENHYFNHDEWSAHAPGLKTVEDAIEMRHRMLYAFEAAEREPDPERRRAWLTFVLVGAGPTGVELAGALAEIANDTLRGNFRSINPEEARILLIDGSDRVLPPFPADLSTKAEKSLVKLGVRTRFGAHVIDIDEEGVTVRTEKGTERISARTVLWAAGVRGAAFGEVLAERTTAQLDRGGRVAVEPDLSIKGHPEIFVIGDLAATGLPGVAPVAMQQGRHVARLIRGEKREPFHYFNKGNLAVIGRAAGVADFGFWRFSGIIAWLIWLFVHLMYLVQFRNRLLVFIRWGFTYLTWDRGARLITGRLHGPPA